MPTRRIPFGFARLTPEDELIFSTRTTLVQEFSYRAADITDAMAAYRARTGRTAITQTIRALDADAPLEDFIRTRRDAVIRSLEAEREIALEPARGALELQRKAVNTAYMAGKLAANRGESAPRVEYQDADLLRAWRRGHRDAKSSVR